VSKFLSLSCRLASSLVWFNAPHGPWEALPAGEYYYNEKYRKDPEYWKNYQCANPHNQRKDPLYSQRWYYKTMVSAMDRSIGKILDTLKELDIEKDTLVVFTSDNGHEMGAGDPAFFKDGKRSLMVRGP
jgi:arylsulfatase A-like enzyme